MTRHARGAGLAAELGVGGMHNGVVFMAYNASGQRCRVEHSFVRALLVHLGLKDMAGGANIRNAAYSRGRRTVIAMAGRAGWSAHIASHRQRFMVNAGVVLGELIGCDGVFFHVARVGMATGAGCSDVDGVDL